MNLQILAIHCAKRGSNIAEGERAGAKDGQVRNGENTIQTGIEARRREWEVKARLEIDRQVQNLKDSGKGLSSKCRRRFLRSLRSRESPVLPDDEGSILNRTGWEILFIYEW